MTNLPLLQTDVPDERYHRTIIATMVNELIKVRPPHDRTAAEVAAGITPVDYGYAPGHLFRYGFSTSSTAAGNVTAFNNALSANGYVFLDKAGTYQVNASLNVQSNQTIWLSQDVTIQGAASVAWADAGIFEISGKSNVRIYGGRIDGNKANNATGRAMGVRIRDSSNVHLYGVTAINCPGSTSGGVSGGDGFYIGGVTAAGSENIELHGCVADANVRQGCSIVKGSRIKIIGGSYINTTGDAPGAGIDIEGNSASDTLLDITITGASIYGNYYGIVVTTAANGVTLVGNKIRANRFSAIYFADCDRVTATGNTIVGGATVSSPIIDMASASDVVFVGNIVIGSAISPEGAGFRILSGDHILIAENEFKTTRQFALAIGNSAITAVPNNIVFRGNTCIDCVAVGLTDAVVNVAGNSGSSIYPLLVTIAHNQIIDTRSAGNEADTAINISTSIPAATQTGYRVIDNRVSGPAAVYTSGAVPPLCGSVVYDPPSLADGAGDTSAAITVVGAATGDYVEVFVPYDLQGVIYQGYVSVADTVRIRLQNETGGTIDLASGTWRVRVRKLTSL